MTYRIMTLTKGNRMKKNSEFKTLQLRISPELHKRIKILCAEKGITIHEYIKTLLDKEFYE